jgi:hypothetical protein
MKNYMAKQEIEMLKTLRDMLKSEK